MMDNDEKREIQRLLSLLTFREDWHNDPETVRKVNELSGALNSDRLQLKPIDFDRFTTRNYLYLMSLGYQVKEVQRASGASVAMFGKWVRENKLTRNYTKDVLKTIEFTNEDRMIPYLKESGASE